MEKIILSQELVDFLDYELSLCKGIKLVENWAEYTGEYDRENGTKIFEYLLNDDNRKDFFVAVLTGYYEVDDYVARKQTFEFIDAFVESEEKKAELLSNWDDEAKEYDRFCGTKTFEWIKNNKLKFVKTVMAW